MIGPDLDITKIIVIIIYSSKFEGEISLIGKVLWYDEDKGVGMIERESGERVHVDASALKGLQKPLREGQEVLFEIMTSKKGLEAKNICCI